MGDLGTAFHLERGDVGARPDDLRPVAAIELPDSLARITCDLAQLDGVGEDT
jgi:hypothetical protein